MGYGIAVVAILSTLSATKYVYKDLPMMIGIYKGKVSFGLCFSVVLEKKRGKWGKSVSVCAYIYLDIMYTCIRLCKHLCGDVPNHPKMWFSKVTCTQLFMIMVVTLSITVNLGMRNVRYSFWATTIAPWSSPHALGVPNVYLHEPCEPCSLSNVRVRCKGF